MASNVTPLHVRHHTKAPWRRSVEEDLGPVSAFLAGFELHLLARGQAAKTIEKKTLAVRQLGAFLGDPDVGALDRPAVEAFIAHRLTVSARSSVATTVGALRAFFAYLALDLGSFDSPLAGVAGLTYEAPAVEPVPFDVTAAMLGAVEKIRTRSFEDVRDAAILRIFIDTGCRLSEVTNLTMSDVLPMGDGRVLLRVWGKGRGGGPRERHVPIGQKAAVALRRYQRARAAHPHQDAPRLWLGRKGPIQAHGVREMVYRRSAAAGMRIHPHQFRHTWAVTMKRDDRKRDGDIMHLAGWTDSKMLARYGRTATAERAVEQFWAHGAPGDSL